MSFKFDTKAPVPLPAKILMILAMLGMFGTVTWLYWPIHVLIFQIYFWIAAVLSIRFSRPLMKLLQGMPEPHLIITGLLVILILAGHFRANTHMYFPFESWEIFPEVREENPVPCREMVGVTTSGKKVRLLVEQIFPSIIQFNLPPEPDVTASDVASNPALQLLEATVRATACEYNNLHPEDPVQHVDLVQVEVPLDPNQPLICRPLHTFSVTSSVQ